MPNRRAFVTGTLALLALPCAARAQDKGGARVLHVGLLDVQPAAANAANLVEFQKGMKELGYVEGRNLVTHYRSAEGRADRLPALARGLVKKPVDVIVARGTPAALAARDAPGAVPVVTAGAVDPVETKLVASMERPGGKVTGLGFLVQEVEAKRMEVLRALAPGRRRIAALLDMGNPAIAETWRHTEAAARALGMQADLIDVRRPEQMLGAVDAAVKNRAEALVVRVMALHDGQRRALVEAIARHKLPAMYAARPFVDAGGLVSYGVNTANLYYRAAAFVDRIVKGAKPAELPMERPSKFELVFNRRALRALDLVVPPDLLLRADEVV